jgi:hypothetical protein
MTADRKKLMLIMGGAIVVLLVIVSALGWKVLHSKTDSATENKATSKRVVQEVGDIYMLPAGEEPTVALIQDKTKLGNQQFFKDTVNGDYLLVYSKAKIALVYRESNHKLVNVGPVNFNDAGSSTSAGQ